jgi:hypothetical protein
LLLGSLYDRTPDNHPDKENIPLVMNAIKACLERVNLQAGIARNRFDLEKINRHLTYKNHKKDYVDLRLLDKDRVIYKQAVLRKNSNMDSTEYQVILLDHYLIVAKVKIIKAEEHYNVRKRVSHYYLLLWRLGP